ncbi:transcriptional regulator [Xenorhabdus lircayensis]|uniref:Transcriptional regulator n=1 Tax=Xenorhabdus lircayensis TaxID=2763499 RepID=A0ABS0U1R0_9GAMM|nr:transcriptional regulator [Xenorhabdus lircayensis]MBI6547819.1 transcriptional regulator [Xenorhabdus lircayensis]
MKNDLHRWKREASKDDWSDLAQIVGTSVGYLNLIAGGFRRASPNMASRIEDGTKKFNGLIPVKKENLIFMDPPKKHVS